MARIQEIIAQLRFGVTGLFQFLEALAKGFDETVKFFFKRLKGGVGRHGADSNKPRAPAESKSGA